MYHSTSDEIEAEDEEDEEEEMDCAVTRGYIIKKLNFSTFRPE